jgi:prepilin-type processing-associated H-X9-DG protein
MPKDRSVGAFTRVDAVVVFVTALVIAGGLLAWLHLRSIHADRVPCLDNLRQIGGAMAMYADDNQARLPYAGMRLQKGIHWTWDDLLNKQLGGHFTKRQLEVSEPNIDMPVLRCPADQVPLGREFVPLGGHRRTYAMPAHDMSDENWPPGPGNRTCIGIRWNLGPNSPSPVFADKWESPSKDAAIKETIKQKSFTTGMVPSPGKTLALAELLQEDNVIGHYNRAAVANVAEQLQAAGPKKATFHGGKFSYLFLDGHADSLDPLQTLNSKNPIPSLPSGLWVVNKGGK